MLRLLADGLTQQKILDEYPDLEDDDIHQALGYAAYLARERDRNMQAATDEEILILAARELQSGSVVVITDDRVRIRPLPVVGE
jgi:hypothetical protein